MVISVKRTVITIRKGMAELLKRCVSCGESKPKTPEHFYYRNKARGWLSSWCKPCRIARRKETASAELAAQRERRNKVIRHCRDCDAVVGFRRIVCDPCKRKKLQAGRKREKCFRKAVMRQATPPWADRDALRQFYLNTPDGHHVDHIMPLRGKTVSGLHIVENLQYLPALENIRKGNRVIA